MLLKTQAATEIARFLAHHPTPEQSVAFHPSAEVAERAYELIRTERRGVLSEEERQELESYVVIEDWAAASPCDSSRGKAAPTTLP